MSGMLERRPGRPVLPDLFGWAESGFPGAHGAPVLHGIRVEEHFTDGTYLLRAELPGAAPAQDVEITIAEGVLSVRAERPEKTGEKHCTQFRYGTSARSVRLPWEPGATRRRRSTRTVS